MRNTLINTPTTKKAALSLAILVSFCLVFGVACGSNTQAPSGALPTWKVGDTWTCTVRHSLMASTYTSNWLVTGQQVYNGIPCYIVQVTNTPPLLNCSAETLWVDTTTLNTIGDEVHCSLGGIDDTSTTNSSWNYSVQPYPLSVGKTWTMIENRTTTILIVGQSNISSEVGNYTNKVKVESVETITVPAGTFKCFKMVGYDNNNSVLGTSWQANNGIFVKSISSNGETWELTSYSSSQ